MQIIEDETGVPAVKAMVMDDVRGIEGRGLGKSFQLLLVR